MTLWRRSPGALRDAWHPALRIVAAGICVTGMGLAAGRADAAYTAEIIATTLNLVGDAASDELVLRLQSGVPTMLEVDVGGNGTPDFVFDRGLFTGIVVVAGAGNDLVLVDETNTAFTDEDLSIDGGEGRDTLIGGSGSEVFIAGADDDLVRAGPGDDLSLLGGGGDSFVWNAGDGNDVIEGEGGNDRLTFNGAGAAEIISLSPNGARLLLSRDVAPS